MRKCCKEPDSRKSEHIYLSCIFYSQCNVSTHFSQFAFELASSQGQQPCQTCTIFDCLPFYILLQAYFGRELSIYLILKPIIILVTISCCTKSDCVFLFLAPLGKRGWKVFYSSLRDLVLYLYKDQQSKNQLAEGTQNAIRIHHCLASKAADYTKKSHVFRLETADWAEYLIQTR